MPAGIGYGPLPPPPGLAAAPAALPPIPGLTEETMLQPPTIPAPGLVEEQALPPLPVTAEPAEAPVPEWLRQQLEAAQIPAAPADPASTPTRGGEVGAATSSGIPVPLWLQPPANAEPAAIDASDPIALAQAGAQTRVDVERAALQSQRVAQQAIRAAEQRTQRRIEEQAERQRQARERVARQNAEIQRALREGPGTTWRDVAAAGIQAAAAMLGAAFDRSGTMQKQLPQIMESIVGQWQARTQGAFARQLQAMQVGREQAQDELDAAMDEERRIEAAGAASRTAILEEAQRQINLAVQEGRVSMAELEAAGIPAQMQAQMDAALAEQQRAAEEAERKRVEQELKLEETVAGIRLKEEQIKGERADRAKTFADIKLGRERLDLEREAREAQTVREEVELHDKRLAAALKSKELEAKDRDRAIILPDGRPILLNSTAEGAQKLAVTKISTARKLGRLVDEIVQASERTGYDPKWLGSKEGQKTRLLWRKLWLSVKDQEELGAITGPDEQILDDVTGADPTSFSAEALRGTAERLRLLKRMTEDEVHDYLDTASGDYHEKGVRFALPTRDDPDKAVPTSQEAVKALLPIRSRVTGQRPRVEPKEFEGAIKTVRETIAREVAAGERRDPLTDQPLGEEDALRVQARELAGTLREMRAERSRLEQEREQVQQQASALPRTDARKTALLKRMEELTREIATVQQYDKRLSKDLERERRLLYQRIRGGDPRAQRNVSPADREAYRAVADMIGEIPPTR